VTELSAYEFSTLRDGPFTLSRGLGDGLAPILLVAPAGDYPSRESLQRLEHEFALREELDADWAARPVELIRRDARLTLALEDRGGEPLARLLGRPLDVAAFLRIAIPLADALGRAHAQGLIHRDIKPANILVDTASDHVWLTGFGIASRLPREHQTPAPPEVIAGTLAYMAPEQTGRMNRSVDSRSDLYALGVTFYEMLTGMLPFTAADPMEWVHAHIARQPVPPSERVPAVPAQVSAIVLKLLAKTAEDRYQTAVGLTVDLRQCLDDLDATGHVESFPLGTHDISDRLLIPERLYGREREIDTLLSAFDRVVAHATPELVLVSGYSGVGKSSVVNELHKVLVPPRGLFASGKFDQYQRDIPYVTLSQAFQSLVRPLLGQSEAELGRWRDALREALGPNGQLIVNLVPELELVLGSQPPLAELSPQDAKSRFQTVFRRFVGVFARPEHPLVLFLDDLQWLDAATLDLLEHLVTHADVRHLLLVGAYRDNEVGPAHPLMRTLAAIRTAGAQVHEILLAPLDRDDVGQLVSAALHCAPDRALPLSQLVHEKTGGNPFFAIQFFTALAEEGLLAFDPGAPGWQWDIDRIRARSYTDNVVELMTGKLKRLSAPTQDALKRLACLGNIAEIATLTRVHGETEEAMHAALWGAVQAGLVLRLESAYTFLHDRIQQAAYSLVPEAHRAGLHLRIGRVLLASMTVDGLAEHVFDVVNQLNRGAALITARDEREQLAELNLLAGRRAKASTAYASALTYLVAGAALLGEDSWERRHELTFALELNRAECEFLTGALAEAEERATELTTRAANGVEQASVACLRMELYLTFDQSGRAVAVGLDYLRHLGIAWSPHPTAEDARQEYRRVWATLGDRPIEALLELPLMSDPAFLATLEVVTKIAVPAWYTDTNLLSLAICRAVNLSVEGGNCDASCFAYATLGLLAGPHFGDYQAGFRFGRLGYDLVEQRGLKRFQARTYMNFGNVVLPWTTHVRAGRDLVRRAFETANQVGDLVFAAFCCHHMNTNMLAAGDPLDEAQVETERGLAFAQKMQFGLAVDFVVPQLGLIRTLRGSTPHFGRFDDEQFDELRIERRYAENPNLAIAECWYWIRKLQARFFAGDYAAALEASERAQPLLWTSPSLFDTAEYHFYGALSRAASCESAAADERRQHVEALVAHHRQLETWAANCPDNFENRAALVGAEIARIDGRDVDAMRLYQVAIRSARQYGFVQNEGVAYEVAAGFYAARGLEEIAQLYRRNARDCYRRWGAEGKVRQLERLHPELRADPVPAPATALSGASVAQLDITAVAKASQAISSEIVLGRLIETLMTIALENAGAERGLLILLHGDVPRIEAEATIDRETVEVRLRQDAVTSHELPESLLHTVIRTRESVILDDASALNPFSADAYIRARHPRSVLCLPLVKQATLIGVLYLENNLASHVFTPARISVLELLSSQAAISLENARLYADLLAENRDRETAEDALRASEERWRNLFENAPVGIALTGSRGNYVAVNPALQRMVGYSEAELCSRSAADITHEDDRAVTREVLAAYAEGQPRTPRFEKRYRRKDGGVIWAEVSAFLVPVAGSTPLLGGVAVDITDRKRAEDELRRSEASLADAQSISHTGSWRWKIATGEVSVSAELRRILAMDPAAAMPSATASIAMVHAEDRPAFQDALDRAVRERRQFEHEYRQVLTDGSVKQLHIVGRPDVGGSGELEYTGVVMDVTERRRAEEALRNAQAELTRVARLTTMGELAASITHEINQPLAAIVSNGSAGLRWLNRATPDLDEVRDALSRMVSDGMRAADVIRGLRALAKKSGPQLTTLDIDDVIQEVLALTHSEVQRHGVVLRIDLAVRDRPVVGDRVQLQQVLLNLILNGIDAMKAVAERPRELAVSSGLVEPSTVLVSVEDSGPGLDPAIAQRIFEPFVTTKSDGLGMGLSICRSIIDAHGGRLWATPRMPHGTVFRFTVPIGVDA
jgi:PAS domain S-box-containing protein